MPKFTKKAPRRGPVRRTMRRKAAAPRTAITRISQRTIPDKLLVKLPYTDLTGISGVGSNNQKSYNINSPYDPETGALNEQNLAFDQYMILFNKYRVYKVDYQVTMYNITPSAVAGSISFSEQGQQTSLTQIQQLQLPYSRRFTLAPSGTTGAMKTIKGSIYLPRVVGKTHEQYRTNDSYVGTVSSNPAQLIQMSLNFMNINVNVSAALQCDVRYTSHCELFDRVNLFATTAPPEGQE